MHDKAIHQVIVNDNPYPRAGKTSYADVLKKRQLKYSAPKIDETPASGRTEAVSVPSDPILPEVRGPSLHSESSHASAPISLPEVRGPSPHSESSHASAPISGSPSVRQHSPEGAGSNGLPQVGILQEAWKVIPDPIRTVIDNKRDTLRQSPQILDNFIFGLGTGDGNASDLYSEKAQAARRGGAFVHNLFLHPLESLSAYLAGDDLGLADPENEGWDHYRALAEAGGKNQMMNLLRVPLADDAASMIEAKRAATESLGDLTGFQFLKNKAAEQDALADRYRKIQSESYERLFDGKGFFWENVLDELLNRLYICSDIYISEELANIPARLPNALRMFSREVQRSQQAGDPALEQIKSGFGKVVNDFIFQRLKGYVCSAMDRAAIYSLTSYIRNNEELALAVYEGDMETLCDAL